MDSYDAQRSYPRSDRQQSWSMNSRDVADSRWPEESGKYDYPPSHGNDPRYRDMARFEDDRERSYERRYGSRSPPRREPVNYDDQYDMEHSQHSRTPFPAHSSQYSEHDRANHRFTPLKSAPTRDIIFLGLDCDWLEKDLHQAVEKLGAKGIDQVSIIRDRQTGALLLAVCPSVADIFLRAVQRIRLREIQID